MHWPFEGLEPNSFDLIVADPPWRFQTWSETNQSKSAARHYAVMETEDIVALPVAELARPNCVLLLWATGAMLTQALDVMTAWGFTYKSQLCWRKTTPAGKVRMGTGYWARSMHEPVLIGTRGKPSIRPALPSLFDGVAREHSRKPDEFFDMVAARTPGATRADLFSRETRDGWSAWGNEVTKFNPPLAAPAHGGLFD